MSTYESRRCEQYTPNAQEPEVQSYKELNWIPDDGTIEGALAETVEAVRPFREFTQTWVARSRLSRVPFITD